MCSTSQKITDSGMDPFYGRLCEDSNGIKKCDDNTENQNSLTGRHWYDVFLHRTTKWYTKNGDEKERENEKEMYRERVRKWRVEVQRENMKKRLQEIEMEKKRRMHRQVEQCRGTTITDNRCTRILNNGALYCRDHIW